MSDGISKLLLMVVVFLLGWLVARRLRPRPGTAMPVDPVARYRWLRGLLIVYGILLVVMVILTVQNHHGSLFQRAWPLVFIAAGFGGILFQFITARKAFRELPESRTRRVRRDTPVFFWQAVLILLPVMLMSAFGFWAIYHQRQMVEQDAQQRAKEVVRALPDDFGRLVAGGLMRYDGPKGGWLSFMENGLAGWPGSKQRKQYLDDPNEINAISNNLAILRTAFPEWESGVPPMASFILETNGEVAWQDSLPPQPPGWLLALSAAQRAAWSTLVAADYAGEPASNLVVLAEALKETSPPAAANVSADFIVLRAQSRNDPMSYAVKRLLDFAGNHYDARSDSGLSLRMLAVAEALHRSQEGGPSEKLWEALRTEAVRAGALAPRLLDDAARMVAGHAPLVESIDAMKVCLAERELRRELPAALAHSGYVSETTITNVWMNALNQRWLCLVQPNEIHSGTSVSNRAVWRIELRPEARCWPKTVVAQGVAQALAMAKVSLPNYFAISCDLEGEPLALPAPWNRFTDQKTTGEVLAEAHFRLSQPAVRLDNSAGGPATETRFESLPGQPRFSLRIHLADRTLLYAQQRQLQVIFGSLIALSLFSAVVGFAAARRAFRRQLQLNEQKSNFVSSVSHELRAPIASVRLMAENLERGKVPEPARQGEYFRFIVQECRRLSSLIENVLDFSRIEQGRKQYEFEPTNIVALAETTVKLMEPYAAEKGVALKLDMTNLQAAALTNELNVDGRALQQALVNLIDNAVKHSPKGETVTVGVESGSGRMAVRIFVADHGPGVPPGERAKIFERFYRLGSELRRETQGVGIGLSVVKHIVEAHGGRVKVEGEAGQGSRFTIELPARTTE